MEIQKQLISFCLLVLMTLCFSVIAQEKSASISLEGFGKLKYTEEQLNSLKTQVVDRKDTYTFYGRLSGQALPKDAKQRERLIEKYEKKGETPFTIFADLRETKEINGKKVTKASYSGNADILILDMENKKVVKTERQSLSKLCPS